MNRLEGKIALISGGTTGMGAAIAKRFQTEGATVIATGANPETLEKARRACAGAVGLTHQLVEALRGVTGGGDAANTV